MSNDAQRAAAGTGCAVLPVERAQQVWRRVLELANPPAHHDRFVLAIDLLRAAHHDPATMMHALTLGRTHLEVHPDDVVAVGAARILEAAIAFLGVKPGRDDISRPTGRDAEETDRWLAMSGGWPR